MSSIIVRMVTYCTGSARQKRAYFSEASGVVVLDNVEVLFCASENGRNYFAYGDVPFSAFTVDEYLKYRRALCGAGAPCELLRKLGISASKRLGRLTAVQMRCVSFLEKTAGRPACAVMINLDGTRYSRRNDACLKRLLSVLPEAYVCVTDERFVRHASADAKILAFGKKVKGARPAFYSARVLAKRIGAKRIAVM